MPTLSLEKLDAILADRKIPIATRHEIVREVRESNDAEARMAVRMRESLNAATQERHGAYIANVLAACARLGVKITAPVDVYTLDRMFAESSHPEMDLKMRFNLKSALKNIGYLR